MPTHKDYIEIISENSKEDPKAVETFLGELRKGLDFAAVSPGNPLKGVCSVQYTMIKPDDTFEVDCQLIRVETEIEADPPEIRAGVRLAYGLSIGIGDRQIVHERFMEEPIKAGERLHLIVKLREAILIYPPIERLRIKVSFTTKTA